MSASRLSSTASSAPWCFEAEAKQADPLWSNATVFNLLVFTKSHADHVLVPEILLTCEWGMSSAVMKKCKGNIWHGIFKAYWFMMIMLAAASHIILEVRENTGNKPKECAIKIQLPKHTDDYGNPNLHNKGCYCAGKKSW